MDSSQLQQDIRSMQGSITQAQAQIDTLRHQIAELENDREGLEHFRSQVNSDKGQFESTLARKRSSAREASGISDSKIAKGIAEMLGNRFGSTFESNISSCFSGVNREIQSALNDIENEIRALNRRIGSLEGEISATRKQITVTEREYDRALKEERARLQE